MSISTPGPILTNSVETTGISVLTGKRADDTPGLTGAIYSASDLAAGCLVGAHQISPKEQILIFGTTWTSATPATLPQEYTAYTVESDPTWFHCDVSTGKLSPLRDRGLKYFTTEGLDTSSFRLNSVVSGVEGLVILGRGTLGGLPVTFLKKYNFTSETHDFQYPASWVEYDVAGVDYSKAAFLDGGFFYNFGRENSTGQIFMRRKSWLSIFSPRADWEYRNNKGWSVNGSEKDPLVDRRGVPLYTSGPISVARYGLYTLMTLVKDTGVVRTGVCYGTVGLFTPWVLQDHQVALGSTGDGSYTGGGLYLQQSIKANPDHPTLKAPSKFAAAIPYCYSIASVSGANRSIKNTWNLLPVASLR